MSEHPIPADVVLVIHGEQETRDQLGGWLRDASHQVVTTATVDDALNALDARQIAVAVCDLAAPGDDHALVERLRRRSPDTAVILTTVANDVGSAARGLRLGVVDCLIKPFGSDRLRQAVRRALDWHESAVVGRVTQARLRAEIEHRRTQLATALNALTIDSHAMLEATLRTLTVGDPSFLEHGRRVAALARAVAGEMQLGVAADALDRAALVHDLPKLAFPDSIARKNRNLLPLERDVIRVSPAFGRDLLVSIDYLRDAAEILYSRYEWWDGSGYPRGLERDAIPLGSRILAVADTFDTLLQPRRYRAALGESDAVTEILRCRGTQFDPAVVEAFHRALGYPMRVPAA